MRSNEMYYWFDARMVELTEFSLSIIWTRNRWYRDIGIIELMAAPNDFY